MGALKCAVIHNAKRSGGAVARGKQTRSEWIAVVEEDGTPTTGAIDRSYITNTYHINVSERSQQRRKEGSAKVASAVHSGSGEGASGQELQEWQAPGAQRQPPPPPLKQPNQLETQITGVQAVPAGHLPDNHFSPLTASTISIIDRGCLPNKLTETSLDLGADEDEDGYSTAGSPSPCDACKKIRQTSNKGAPSVRFHIRPKPEQRQCEASTPVEGQTFCQDSLALVEHEGVECEYWNSDCVCFCDQTGNGIAHHANGWRNTPDSQQCYSDAPGSPQVSRVKGSRAQRSAARRQNIWTDFLRFRRSKCCKAFRFIMMYSAILVIGAIVIYLFHSKCMGLGEADMTLNLPSDSAPQHQSPCQLKSSAEAHYRGIKRSAERLDAVTKYFIENMIHDERNDSSLEVWLELVEIQQSLKEMYTNITFPRGAFSNNQSRTTPEVPLILNYARIFLPQNLQGAIIQQVSNETMTGLRNGNESENGVLEALRDSVLILMNNVGGLDKEVNENRKSHYDHLQAISGDILKLYESAKSQNQTAEQMKSVQAKIMEKISMETNKHEACTNTIRDLRANVSDLHQVFEGEFLILLENITLMDERVTLLEMESHDGFYAQEDMDDEYEKESKWATMLKKLQASAERNIDVSDNTDNQSVSLNSPGDLQVIQNKIDFISQEVEQVIHHVEERLAEFGGKVNSLEQKISSADGLKEKITRKTCSGMRRHLIQNSCYYIPRIPRDESQYTWWDARFLCKEHLGRQADLVAVETNEEMEAIINMLANHFGGMEEFWIGASDLENEGTWIWSGTEKHLNQQTFSYWAEFPQISTDTNCMSMLRGYKWVDEPCFYERTPICELRL